MTATYDDRNLQRLFAELDKPTRLKAIKTAFRREANKVKKAADTNLRVSGIHNAAKLSRGIRAIVFKRKAGFRVTVGSKKANKQGKGERGMHKNRRGQKKPILIWAEDGTVMRKSKSVTPFRVGGGKWRQGYKRGFMPRYGFMRKTLEQVRGKVTDELHNEVRNAVTEIAKKYGCM